MIKIDGAKHREAGFRCVGIEIGLGDKASGETQLVNEAVELRSDRESTWRACPNNRQVDIPTFTSRGSGVRHILHPAVKQVLNQPNVRTVAQQVVLPLPRHQQVSPGKLNT